MKHLKKFSALLLALVMILSLSVTAFAESSSDTGTTFSITISNPAVGDTYSAYKIFDVTYTTTCADGEGHLHTDACYNVSYKISATYDAADATKATDVWAAVLRYMAITEADSNPTTGKTAETDGSYTGNGLTLTPSAGNPDVFVVSTTTSPAFSAANFAKYMASQKDSLGNAAATNGSITAGTTTPVTLTVTDSGAGYYLVVCTGNNVHDKTPALAELTTTKPTVTIQDKNSIPFEKKVDDPNGVEIGQVVTYTITGEVPSTSGYDTYTYKVSDKMSQGLTFDLSSVKITVGTGADAVKYYKGGTDEYAKKDDTNWTVTGIYGYWDDTTSKWVTANDDGAFTSESKVDGKEIILVGFTADVDFVQTVDGNKVQGSNKYSVGDKIEITYSATVNDAAVSVVSQNEATLTYSNDPDSTETTKPVNADVYSSKIQITKFDAATAKNQEADSNKDPNWRNATGEIEPATTGGNVTYLENAEFVLYKNVTADGTTTTYYYQAYRAPGAGETVNQLITRIDNTTSYTIVDVDWTTDKTQATTFVTDTTGAATIPGLEDGTYYLLETKAPDGYNLLEGSVPVTVNGAGATAADVTTLTFNADVANSAGTILPSTGGMGTTIFYIVGAVLVLGAAVLLVTKRRMNADK